MRNYHLTDSDYEESLKREMRKAKLKKDRGLMTLLQDALYRFKKLVHLEKKYIELQGRYIETVAEMGERNGKSTESE